MLSSVYVPNLTGESYHAAIPEARHPQLPTHTDLHAASSALNVPRGVPALPEQVKPVLGGGNAGSPNTCSLILARTSNILA